MKAATRKPETQTKFAMENSHPVETDITFNGYVKKWWKEAERPEIPRLSQGLRRASGNVYASGPKLHDKRSLEADEYLVVLNLSHTAVEYAVPSGTKAGHLLLSNSDVKEEDYSVIHLNAWDARIYKVY